MSTQQREATLVEVGLRLLERPTIYIEDSLLILASFEFMHLELVIMTLSTLVV